MNAADEGARGKEKDGAREEEQVEPSRIGEERDQVPSQSLNRPAAVNLSGAAVRPAAVTGGHDKFGASGGGPLQAGNALGLQRMSSGSGGAMQSLGSTSWSGPAASGVHASGPMASSFAALQGMHASGPMVSSFAALQGMHASGPMASSFAAPQGMHASGPMASSFQNGQGPMLGASGQYWQGSLGGENSGSVSVNGHPGQGMVFSFSGVPSFAGNNQGSQNANRGGLFKTCQAKVELWKQIEVHGGDVERIERIGDGSFATVFKGRAFGTDVAIKIWKKNANAKQLKEAVSRVKQEARRDGCRRQRNRKLTTPSIIFGR